MLTIKFIISLSFISTIISLLFSSPL